MGRIGRMTPVQDGQGRRRPVERYHATSGRFVGSMSLAVVAVVLAYVAVDVHSLDGLRLATGALLFGVLVWLTQLRPRAAASADMLRLQNSLRDVDVPLALVDDVHVGRMLSVWVGEERYDCIGIGAPLRTMVKRQRSGGASAFGWDRLEQDSEHPTPPRPAESTMSYPAFVESRITALAEDARRRRRRTPEPQDERPRKVWAWPGIVALAVTALAFAVTLLR